MIVNVYQRRIRTDSTRVSPYTKRAYAPSYRWGIVDGKPRWIRVASIESGSTEW